MKGVFENKNKPEWCKGYLEYVNDSTTVASGSNHFMNAAMGRGRSTYIGQDARSAWMIPSESAAKQGWKQTSTINEG